MSIIDNHNTFLETDLSEFKGKWIAIIDKKIVANDKDLSRVLETVKKEYPGKKPLIAKAPSEKPLIL